MDFDSSIFTLFLGSMIEKNQFPHLFDIHFEKKHIRICFFFMYMFFFQKSPSNFVDLVFGFCVGILYRLTIFEPEQEQKK